MSTIRVTMRLARRAAWRERWTMLLAAGFVSLAVAVGIAAFANTGSGTSSDARFRFEIAGGAGVADPPPLPLRTADGTVAVSGNGVAYRVVLGRPGDDVTATRTPSAVTAAAAPAGSRAISFRSRTVRLVGHQRAIAASLEDLDPHAAGASMEVRLVDGRGPRSAGEVALTRGAAHDLRVGIGDRVTVVGAAAAPLRVVGLVEAQSTISVDPAGALGLLAPDSLAGTGASRVWRIDVPGSAATAIANSGAGQGVAVGPQGSPAPGALAFGYEGASAASTTAAASAGIALYLLVLQSLILLLPLFLSVAILAIGGARRGHELRLLTLQGASERTMRALATVRGALVAVVAVALAVVEILALRRLTTFDASIRPLAIFLPGVPALVGCIVASNVALRTARRIERGDDRPATPAELRRSLLRGAVAVAAAVALIAFLGTGGGGLLSLVRELLGIAAVGSAVTGVALLGAVAVALPGLLPLPGASRAALRAVSRARWVSAPAAVAVALAAVLLFLVGAGTTPTRSSGATPRSDVVSIAAGTRSDAAGRIVVPAEVVRRLVPQTRALAELRPVAGPFGTAYVIAPADAAVFGIRLSAAGPSVLYDLCDHASYGDAGTVHVVTVAHAGWPASGPCLLATAGASDVREPSLWLVRLPATPTTDELHRLAVATDAEGLVLAAGQENPLSSNDAGGLAGSTVGVATAGLVLVFCAVATALVLAERREETRRLALAGARTRDLRIAAAASALGFGVAALALMLILVGLMVFAAAFGDGPGALIDRLPETLGPSVAVPVIVALGAALLTRAPRTGRIGRVPRRPA